VILPIIRIVMIGPTSMTIGADGPDTGQVFGGIPNCVKVANLLAAATNMPPTE
jgi:hypothetical protein